MNTIYIDGENINYINKYGYVGLFLIIAKDENIYFDDIEKSSYDVDDEYLIKYIQKNAEYFKRKFERIETIEIPGNLITNNVNALVSNNLNKKIFVTGFLEDSELLMNMCANQNVYIKDVALNRLTIEQVETYINLKKNNKVLKRVFDDQLHKDKLAIDNDLEDFCFNIKTLEEMDRVIKICKNNPEMDKITLNVMLSNLDLLRRIITFAEYNDYIELNINATFDIKNIDISRIPRSKNENCKWNINAYGIDFNEYYEFYNFNNLMKFLNNKIPKEATDIEKTIFISNFIVNYFEYDDKTYGNKTIDSKGERVDTSISDVVQLGSGVCRHYASIAKCLLNYFDIECDYVGSETRSYVDALNNGEEIEYDENGRKVNEDFISHAFNIVHLDGKSYWLDLTWCDFNEYGIANDPNFLVSTDTFSSEHGEFIELDNYICENDYDREKIQSAIYNISLWNSEMTVEDVNWLSSNGYSNLTQKEDSLIPKRR